MSVPVLPASLLPVLPASVLPVLAPVSLLTTSGLAALGDWQLASFFIALAGSVVCTQVCGATQVAATTHLDVAGSQVRAWDPPASG